jgi:hypothetical protein
MKNILTCIICLLTLSNKLFAQHAHFTTSGTIEFERKTNMYAIIPKMFNKDNEAWLGPLFDAYKKAQPHFKLSKCVLSFANNKPLFPPAEE